MSGLAAAAAAPELGAHFCSELALRLEQAGLTDDSLAGGNLVAVAGHLYSCGLVQSVTVYSLLEHFNSR